MIDNEIFEIHLTGKGPLIHEVGQRVGLKTIEIELLTPEGSVLRTEHMTSYTLRAANFNKVMCEVSDHVTMLRNNDVEILRIKVESPPYDHYLDKSIYVEAHFPAGTNLFSFPTSRNVRSGKLLATRRTYKPSEYKSFISGNSAMAHEVELCLLDTFVREDQDWLDLWSSRE